MKFSGMGIIRSVLFYVNTRKITIGKFFLVSGSAVLLNLLLLFIMVRYLGMDSRLGENLANFFSMEIGIIYNFFMSRAITWKDRNKEHGMKLFVQMCKFHIAIGITIVMRTALFAFLQLLGVFYILNAIIGIALAAGFNFVIYDSIIFERRK